MAALPVGRLVLNDAATDAAYLRCDKRMLLVIGSISTYSKRSRQTSHLLKSTVERQLCLSSLAPRTCLRNSLASSAFHSENYSMSNRAGFVSGVRRVQPPRTDGQPSQQKSDKQIRAAVNEPRQDPSHLTIQQPIINIDLLCS